MEIGESRYPMLFRKLALWEDSGGAGRWRGGLGYCAEVEWLRGESTITFRRERMKFQPWGIGGGGSAPSGRTEYVPLDGDPHNLPGKTELRVTAGDRLRYWIPGSGGHDDPLQRGPEQVLEDVLNGRVSVEAARDDYGVIIENDAVDEVSTTKLRESRLQ
jgi:N-methylhydantoinase B